MRLRVYKEMAEAIGFSLMDKEFAMSEEAFRWNKVVETSVGELGRAKVERLVSLCQPFKSRKQFSVLIKDVEMYYKLKDSGAAGVPIGNVRQGYMMLREFLNYKGHRLYEHDADRAVWVPYFVEQFKYTPPHKRKVRSDEDDDKFVYITGPAYVDMHLQWFEMGGKHSKSVTFTEKDMLTRTVEQVLLDDNFTKETPELRAEYMSRHTRYLENYNKIGAQFLARGKGTQHGDDDGDDEDDYGHRRGGRRNYWWSRWTAASVTFDKGGEPAKVVIDVMDESDKESKTSTDFRTNTTWWDTDTESLRPKDDDDEAQADDGVVNVPSGKSGLEVAKALKEETHTVEVPNHHEVVVFDLARHKRYQVNMGQLEDYPYDRMMGAKLILPKDHRNLIEVLVSNASEFQDVVKNKSGGAITLCSGPPGVGKTLTAEVITEVMCRPLYTVQASQLGLDAEGLEKELLKVMARATRWNAILLIDEVDVYVCKRGTSLQQNAIVGVFLRVLEYFRGVLFMTTNRADDVDDAVASRCIARIQYSIPSPPDQKRIWRVLADGAGIAMTDETIQETVRAFPALSGRDVKNILKLASRVAKAQGKLITSEVIKFAKKYKPTADIPVAMFAQEAEEVDKTIPARDVIMGQWYYLEDGAMMYAAFRHKDDRVHFQEEDTDTAKARDLMPGALVTPAA